MEIKTSSAAPTPQNAMGNFYHITSMSSLHSESEQNILG